LSPKASRRPDNSITCFHGCEKVQGYFISKPLPIAAAEEFIRNHQPMNWLGTVELWAGT
jgi:hypothetical protein